METWSNRAIKTALSRGRCPLRHIRISAQSVDSSVERWAVQLAHYRASGTAQKSLVEYQLYIESHGCNCVESNPRLLHTLLSFPGSLRQVLASPDREIAPLHLPRSKTFGTLILHEEIVRSGQDNSARQRPLSSTIYRNLSRIGGLLPATGCAPSWPLSGKRDGTEICRAVPIIHRISAFQLRRIHW